MPPAKQPEIPPIPTSAKRIAVDWLLSWCPVFRAVPRRAYVACFVLLGVFIVMAVLMRWKSIGLAANPVEQGIAEWVHARPDLRANWAVQLTRLGDGLMIRKFYLLTVLFLLLVRKWEHVPALLLGVLGGMDLTNRLQAFLGRVRPSFPDVTRIESFGFPSGHTTNAAVFFGFWILFLLTECRWPRIRALGITLCVVAVLCVGVTRVALLAHWPTDVLGGVAFSWAWITFCFFGNRALFEQTIGRPAPAQTVTS